MIEQVTLRNFKRFQETTFNLPGHVVLAGPNDSGKTTLLQAIAAFGLALRRWKELNDFQRHGGSYTKAPIARQAFHAVPMRSFDLLWRNRSYKDKTIEIEIKMSGGGILPGLANPIAMELIPDSTEQIYVRPKNDTEPDVLRELSLDAVFVPAMSGLSIEEPVYQHPKIEQLLGQARPGEVLRNLLVEANANGTAWPSLEEGVRRLFNVHLLPPSAEGPHIMAEYQEGKSPDLMSPRLDISSGGAGFQQVLMLLAFLHTRKGAVLLLDEPDAHLHHILKSAIYGELQRVAAQQNSQLIIATHSGAVINIVDPQKICILAETPRLLANNQERATLLRSFGIVSQEDISNALIAPGVIYLENYTDLQILQEWARILEHQAHEFLTSRLFWKKAVLQPVPHAEGVQARDHYRALELIKPDIRGLLLVDGDAHPGMESKPLTEEGLQQLRWKRYEIESYLIHPDVLTRFVQEQVGEDSAQQTITDLHRWLGDNLPRGILENPLGENLFLNNTKARTEILPPALNAAGLLNFDYTRYHEIAAAMEESEIHPDVVEVLDTIKEVFKL